MTNITKIEALENGKGFKATFENATSAIYNELFALDFADETNASYNNAALGLNYSDIAVNATVSAADQATIIDALNAQAAEGVLFVNATDAASLDSANFSTIYVGDSAALAAIGSFAGIAETTGDNAAATKGDNAFVLAAANYDVNSLIATIAHEAAHLAGTLTHDYANNGLTLDDFFDGDIYTAHTSASSKGYTYENDLFNNISYNNTSYGPNVNNNGGAVNISAQTVSFKSVTFSGNTSQKRNSGEWNGGAAYTNQSKTSFTNSTFTDNSAAYGGAIYTTQSDTTFTGSTFSGNRAVNGNGGAIAIRTVNGYSREQAVNGNVSDASFSANTASQNGGAVYISGNGTISNANFVENNGSTNGGAVYIGGNGKVTKSDFTENFTANTNTNGGAIYINGAGTISNCNFDGNTAGSVYTKEISGGVAYDGNSNTGGGAIYMQGGTITGCTFTNNVAENGAGGAVYGGSQSKTLYLEDCVFDGNTAVYAGGTVPTTDTYNAYGGAVFVQSSSTINIKNCQFLTESDQIWSMSTGKIVFSGEKNVVNACIWAATITLAKDAVLKFNNATDFNYRASSTAPQWSMEGNATLILHGDGEINLSAKKDGTSKYIAQPMLDVGNNTLYLDILCAKYGLVGEKANDVAGIKNLDQKATREKIQVSIDGSEYQSLQAWLDAGSGIKWNAGTASTVIDGATVNPGAISMENTTRGMLMSETKKVFGFHGFAFDETPTGVYTARDGIVDNFGTVTLGCNKVVQGSTISLDGTSDPIQTAKNIILNGRIYADGKSLEMNDLTYQGRIYGDTTYSDSATAKGSTITLNNVTFQNAGTTYGRIYGGADITAGTVSMTGGQNISLELNLSAASTVGNVYGGGFLSKTDCTYKVGDITTTISGGYYKYYVGNGTQANDDCTVTQGVSTLKISGGTFDSYVYAGGYLQTASTSVTCDNTVLEITGGTFNSNVYGGCVVSGAVSMAVNTSINGNSSVTVDSSSSRIVFGRNLIAGSIGKGAVQSTTLTFTGLGKNLVFSNAGSGDGEYGYIEGGCSGDTAWSEKNPNTNVKTVAGDRNLVFDHFSGEFGANVRNMLETVTFSASTVTLTGPKEVDLRFVETWGFDISDDLIDLTWNSTGKNDYMNDFTDDKFAITGDADTTGKVLMAGDAKTLKNWEKIGSIEIDNVTYANNGMVDGELMFSDGSENRYKLFLADGTGSLKNLTIASL